MQKLEWTPSMIKDEISNYFKTYALELYGAQILEIEQRDNLTVKTVFDKIFEE